MSLSRLLLVASSSKKYITGEGRDQIIIEPKSNHFSNDPYAGEVVLCFQLDDKQDREKRERIARSLGIQDEEKRSDGLIFYAKDGQDDKVICLVEMKGTNISVAAEQIKSTREHIKELLYAECEGSCNRELQRIKWKACLYHHGTSLDDIGKFLKQLRGQGFAEVERFSSDNNNAGPFLRGEISAKDMAKKYRRANRR